MTVSKKTKKKNQFFFLNTFDCKGSAKKKKNRKLQKNKKKIVKKNSIYKKNKKAESIKNRVGGMSPSNLIQWSLRVSLFSFSSIFLFYFFFIQR